MGVVPPRYENIRRYMNSHIISDGKMVASTVESSGLYFFGMWMYQDGTKITGIKESAIGLKGFASTVQYLMY